MTEPVIGIGGMKEIGGNSRREGIFKREKGKRHPDEAPDDNVDISDEARSRASGKKRGNILEYLENAQEPG